MISKPFRVMRFTAILLLTCFEFCILLKAEPSPSAVGQTPAAREAVDPAYISQETIHFRAFLEKMVDVLNSDAQPPTKDLAVNALREFKYVNAIPALIRNLTIVPKRIRNARDMMLPIGQYSCALALYDFGQASVDPLIMFIRNSNNKLDIEVAAYTISEILGKDVAVQKLTSSIEPEASIAVKNNLSSAVRTLNTSN